MPNPLKLLAFALVLLFPGIASSQTAEKPVIVLVHGAFAESSSWNGVIGKLEADGYRVIAAGNPLRSVKTDGAEVAALVRSVKAPVVLVGHSYGGPVITEAADGTANIKALVYVAAFAPEVGESALTLSSKFPGSTLGDALLPVPLADGGVDLYIQSAKFHHQFAADVSAREAALMAATQRPVTQAALAEPTRIATWKTLPVYAIYGSQDLNIPAQVHKFMAERAHALKTVEIAGASHALMVSHPAEVAAMIEAAATAK